MSHDVDPAHRLHDPAEPSSGRMLPEVPDDNPWRMASGRPTCRTRMPPSRHTETRHPRHRGRIATEIRVRLTYFYTRRYAHRSGRPLTAHGRLRDKTKRLPLVLVFTSLLWHNRRLVNRQSSALSDETPDLSLRSVSASRNRGETTWRTASVRDAERQVSGGVARLLRSFFLTIVVHPTP